MLKKTKSSGLASRMFQAEDEVVGRGGNGTDETMRNSFKSRKSKNDKFGNLTRVPTIKATEGLIFLTLDAKKAFNHLRQAFIKAPILQYFDLECYIWIKTDASGYPIGGIFSQLNSDWVTPDKACRASDSNSDKSKKLVGNLTKSNFSQ